MKKIVVLGAGAQGSVVVRHLDREAPVKEIVSADYDLGAARALVKGLKKAKALEVDANNIEEILAAAKGAQLIVNALPPDFNPTVMEAALKVGANYQDLATGPVKACGFVESVTRELDLNDKFKSAGLSALICAGSAPGLTSVVGRHGADKLDSCQRIEILMYDAIWTKRFIPFWWSPSTAFGDMAMRPTIWRDGKFVAVEPFGDPVVEDLRGIGPRRMVYHQHEEAVTYALFIKGLKYAALRYGGANLEYANKLYLHGLLGMEPVEINGTKVVPLDLVCRLTPPAPSTAKQIREVVDEGIDIEEGALVVRIEGLKNGKQVRLDNYINAPGLTEASEKYGMSHETVITGQCAFLFTKLFVHNKIQHKGVFPPEELELETREYYLQEAAKLDISVDEITENRLA
jgi:saccharopine dehydrogenase-like NADP-dependent oxidoreductase